MKKAITTMLLVLAASLLFLVSTQPVFAQDGANLYKTKTCIACHGPDAKTPLMPVYPRLAGQNEIYLLNQMKDIKSGKRSNGNSAAMKGVMHLVTDAEMEAISKWLSTLPKF
ncbi:MAG: cytochrome c [Deltaproteobacteria bacterium]|nr:cytochrome c [Deltaproteobacteria bacterium]